MPEDRSLDEFIDAGAGSDNDDPVDGEDDSIDEVGSERDGSEHPERDGSEPPDDGVIPARSTSTWTSGGVACPRCGTVVERRWIDDDEAVCADCFQW
ncbi:DUF7573 domain-containing protein [Halorubrum vacuolatum]|uniref:DUF7573 domain-containing protein n=1 Tax=Halorubrum vacuolatum TaxID=63740 RepID=A0A238VYQ3_HALVU|nr:hypothetical protein [Halorubrum vacuolatum]SNR38599.1 hypothetical protein SAMN06264855_104162 [Halorubrum vacuolatum]